MTLSRADTLDNPYTIDADAVERRFDRAASDFDDADFVHALSREGLFTRMQGITVDAATVIDLGCGTGAAIRPLAKRFRRARIVGIDRSRGMLLKCLRRRLWLTRSSFLRADARALPIADAAVDVVFSNLLLPWVGDPAPVASEAARVLRRDGLFVFSTLGPDTLGALRDAWAAVDEHVHVNRFTDMHDVGDSLVRSGLRDPVLDVDRIAITYRHAGDLFRDLTASGARNALAHRQPGLTGRARIDKLCRRLESGGKLSIEVEIVFGHCWGSGRARADGAVHVDASQIPIRKR